MSGGGSNKGQSGGRGPRGGSRPTTGARSIRSTSQLLLVGVIFIVAVLMVVSFAGFVAKPDPAVKAGPMYVTLTLTTGAALLMLVLAVNATYLPIMSRQRARDFQLVMWAMAGTGIVTGILALGQVVSPYVTRLVLASIAFAFITIQDARLARARAAAPAVQASSPAPRAQPRSRARQRRGGRKR